MPGDRYDAFDDAERVRLVRQALFLLRVVWLLDMRVRADEYV
jgi:hypothetical protein